MRSYAVTGGCDNWVNVTIIQLPGVVFRFKGFTMFFPFSFLPKRRMGVNQLVLEGL